MSKILPKFIYLNSRSRIGIYEGLYADFYICLEYRRKRKFLNGYVWFEVTNYPANNKMEDVNNVISWLKDYRQRKIDARKEKRLILENIDKL